MNLFARSSSVIAVAALATSLRATSAVAATSGFASVDCGGAAAGAYVADTNASGGATKSRTDLIDMGNVVNPAPLAVYQSQRYGDFTYTFAGFTAGSVNLVRLHFADTHWNARGQRLFNVSINGTQVLTSYDIVAKSGSMDRAIVESFNSSASSSGTYVIKFTTVTDAATVSGIEVLPLSVPMKRNWLQFGGDSAHSGANTVETKISTSNYTQLRPLTGWTTFPVSQSPPVILTNTATASVGATDIAFLNNRGALVGFSPTTGAMIWPTATMVGKTAGESSPAIDPNLQTVYNIGADGCVHKYDVYSASEYVGAGAGTKAAVGATPPACRTDGWPESYLGLTAPYAKTSITIGLAGTNKYLYVANCDGQGSHGKVTTINITDGSGSGHQNSTTAVSGSWARAGLTYDQSLQRLFVPTVDGDFTPPTSYGYTVLALSPDGSTIVDSYTPSPVLGNDHDLGSVNTLVLPMSPLSYSPFTHLGLQSGKDGYTRLIDLTNMSGQGGPNHLGTTNATLSALGTQQLPTLPTPPVCGESGPPCAITSPISTWYNPANDTTYAFINGPVGLNALSLLLPPNGHDYVSTAWTRSTSAVAAGGTFVANGVLYYSNANGLWACNALGPASTCFSVAAGTSISHATPVVVNGILYFNGVAYTVP
ncbi:MAG TPA: malectin domain-containing carbohydrate-binding protein [Polyangia bacterium]|nr:malectin domain-containing carbohydrate-binding protein [Polyangia bacterium]